MKMPKPTGLALVKKIAKAWEPGETQSTHWEDCWRSHAECAIQALLDEYADVAHDRDYWKAKYDRCTPDVGW